MVLRHKTPETGVGGVVAVVAHHEVVVHCEGIAGGDLSVNQDIAVFHLQVVTFVVVDDLLVQGDILGRNLHRHAFLRDGERTEEVFIPLVIAVVREDVGTIHTVLLTQNLHFEALLLNSLSLLAVQHRHIAV